MDSNEIEIRRLVSNLQMKAALITAISILFAGGLLFCIFRRDAVSFVTFTTCAVVAIAGVSAIRYTVFCRNTVLKGSISYLQSVLFGFRFFFLSGMVITLGVYLFLRFHPQFFADLFAQMELQYQYAVENGIKMLLSLDELQKEKQIVLSLSSYSIAFNLWFSYLFMGTVATFIYSPFIAKKGVVS